MYNFTGCKPLRKPLSKLEMETKDWTRPNLPSGDQKRNYRKQMSRFSPNFTGYESYKYKITNISHNHNDLQKFTKKYKKNYKSFVISSDFM